jgi:hypothetical protein
MDTIHPGVGGTYVHAMMLFSVHPEMNKLTAKTQRVS